MDTLLNGIDGDDVAVGYEHHDLSAWNAQPASTYWDQRLGRLSEN